VSRSFRAARTGRRPSLWWSDAAVPTALVIYVIALPQSNARVWYCARPSSHLKVDQRLLTGGLTTTATSVINNKSRADREPLFASRTYARLEVSRRCVPLGCRFL
jgi:hypothetical protein